MKRSPSHRETESPRMSNSDFVAAVKEILVLYAEIEGQSGLEAAVPPASSRPFRRYPAGD